jgi:hypothetical protein
MRKSGDQSCAEIGAADLAHALPDLPGIGDPPRTDRGTSPRGAGDETRGAPAFVALLPSALFLVVPSLSARTKRPVTAPDAAISPGAAMSPSFDGNRQAAGHGATQPSPTRDTRAPSGQSGTATSPRGTDEPRPSARDAAAAARILDAHAVWVEGPRTLSS